MNDDHAINRENLLRAFPYFLSTDERQEAFAKLTAEELAKRAEEVRLAVLYANIDILPERVLDILAYDFKVDWWDTAYTLEEKRETLKGAWEVHRHLGTKRAVETAISAIYPNGKVKEWFDYGGEPYHFRLEIDTSREARTIEQQNQVLDRVGYYKNLRSHLDSITYNFYFPENETVRAGGVMGTATRTPIMEAADEPSFRDTVRTGGALGAMVRTPIREG